MTDKNVHRRASLLKIRVRQRNRQWEGTRETYELKEMLIKKLGKQKSKIPYEPQLFATIPCTVRGETRMGTRKAKEPRTPLRSDRSNSQLIKQAKKC